MSSRKHWSVSSEIEASKLSSKEDWNLPAATATTRTRHGGRGRSNYGELLLGKRKKAASGIAETNVDGAPHSPVTISESENDDNRREDPSSDDTAEVSPPQKKPRHTRVILEVSQLEQAFSQFACPKCQSQVEVQLDTICVASSLHFSCNNEECAFEFSTKKPQGTGVHANDNKKYVRMTDYAVNVLYVCGFLAMGDGGTEAGKLLGLLGLPNDTTMETRSFAIIEERLSPFIQDLCDEILLENLIKEAKISMQNNPNHTDEDFDRWRASLTDDTIIIADDKKPRIEASYDMAWQTKGSGHTYNSQSGHGSMMGRNIRGIIGLQLKSKGCNICQYHEKKHPNEATRPAVREHRCTKNHNGSSGSMESAACVELLIEYYDKKNVIISKLCCDDDSSIRADCQWDNETYLRKFNTSKLPQVPKKVGKNKGELHDRPDNGKLPERVPQPEFCADPNHRRKGLHGKLLAWARKIKKDRQTLTKMDCTRIAKNYGYMARTLPSLVEGQYCTKCNAVLEHHFDNHQFCGAWCRRKDETSEQRKMSAKYYRCKEKDAELYKTLSTICADYFELERLKEISHGMDTNVNEAFNNTCTWFAPKNKVFSGSDSLRNRLSLAVGINSLGVSGYFERLFHKLGIELEENVKHYLDYKEQKRRKRLQKLRTRELKKYRNKRKYERLKEQTRVAKKEYLQRAGKYCSNMNMDDPLCELVEGYDEAKQQEKEDKQQQSKDKTEAKKRVPKKPPQYCEYCGKKGHVTTRAKDCQEHGNKAAPKLYRRSDGTLLSDAATQIPAANDELSTEEVRQSVAADQANNDDADDVDAFDTMPLEDIEEEEKEGEELDGEKVEEQEQVVQDNGQSDDDDGNPGMLDSDEDVSVASSGMDLFHDAGTWSEDEDGGVVLLNADRHPLED